MSQPYAVRVADRESPRTLVEHDRLILPGSPQDWIAAPDGADLVLCARRVPAVIVIVRQFCSASSATAIANSEVEEISFIDGESWLADDLYRQIDAGVPAELAEDLRQDVAMASPALHVFDQEARIVVHAPEVARRVAEWTIVPMSRALGNHGASAAAGCSVRHADLRRGLVPARRLTR